MLSGTFSDEHGDQPAGTWVRNGVGSRHAPFTDEGCVILVKLWWMHPHETASSQVNTRAPDGWRALGAGEERPLHRGTHEHTRLWRIPAGHAVATPYEGGLELFVIEGTVQIDGVATPRWGWERRPAAGTVRVEAVEDGLVYVKEGHLAALPPAP